MISKTMVDAFNHQINAEMFSSYLYLSMAAYFEDLGLPGLTNWMKVQAQEEMVHAMKFFNELAERDGRVRLAAIDQPETEWESPLAVAENVYGHEQKVTALINNLVTLARKENDYASEAFLQWFVTEQVEEESSAKTLVDQLRLIQGHPQGLFMVDRELGARVFTPPPAGE
ncbi:MAG: ferritin [Lentisphaeria bacterium]|nr:ferritin [Lentisphaeria bacterium]